MFQVAEGFGSSPQTSKQTHTSMRLKKTGHFRANCRFVQHIIGLLGTFGLCKVYHFVLSSNKLGKPTKIVLVSYIVMRHDCYPWALFWGGVFLKIKMHRFSSYGSSHYSSTVRYIFIIHWTYKKILPTITKHQLINYCQYMMTSSVPTTLDSTKIDALTEEFNNIHPYTKFHPLIKES
jgi:hypothetical protein